MTPVPTVRPLFTITADLMRVNELFDRAEDGEVPHTDAHVALLDWLAGLEREQEQKLDSYLYLMSTLETHAAAAKAQAELFLAKHGSYAERAAVLKGRLKEHLERTGQREALTASGRVVRVQKNGGTPPLVFTREVQPAALPDRFKKVAVTPNEPAIKAALKAGEVLDFAALGEAGTHLRVGVK